jgi:hypothetical protein
VLVVAHHSAEGYLTPHPAEIPLPDAAIPRAWVFLWVNAAFFMGFSASLRGISRPARSIAKEGARLLEIVGLG